MTRVCTICTHPERREIDRALVRRAGVRDIAKRFHVGKSSVERHQMDGHVLESVKRAAQDEDVAAALDVLAELRAINAVSVAIMKKAKDGDQLELSLKATDRILRQLAFVQSIRDSVREYQDLAERLAALEVLLDEHRGSNRQT